MAFTPFKTLAEVVKTYQLHFTKADEAAIYENLIYPVFKAAWKPYADILALWSHQSIEYNET